jgi:leucyl aminopeptidase
MDLDRDLDCLAAPDGAGLPVHPTRPASLDGLLASLPHAEFVRAVGFRADAGQLALIPGDSGPGDAGIAAALVGLGGEDPRSPWPFGDLATSLPPGTVWHVVPGDCDPNAAALGFCLGAYRFPAFKEPKPIAALVPPPGGENGLRMARATWLVRDLVNLPANHLGPEELAEAAASLGRRFGASVNLRRGEALDQDYPALAAVGRGSARPPVVAVLHWSGPGAGPSAPLVSLCGKGVVFDSGGLDLKPSAAMLRMKKDMGGAALMLGLARLVMEAGLPVRLAVRIGCVENLAGAHAMRPLDVLRTRSGITVEVGNTDAEGRLVLADLLAEAAEERPGLLLDAATLTGAARVALGPDLPALFTPDDSLAARLLAAGDAAHDPLWRLPLWNGYASWLASPTADTGTVGAKPMAGAIVAALFLRRFVPDGMTWAHLDTYAWNDAPRPGRPEGGEALGLRALFGALACLNRERIRG